jgi:hypothetical protein
MDDILPAIAEHPIYLHGLPRATLEKTTVITLDSLTPDVDRLVRQLTHAFTPFLQAFQRYLEFEEFVVDGNKSNSSITQELNYKARKEEYHAVRERIADLAENFVLEHAFTAAGKERVVVDLAILHRVGDALSASVIPRSDRLNANQEVLKVPFVGELWINAHDPSTDADRYFKIGHPLQKGQRVIQEFTSQKNGMSIGDPIELQDGKFHLLEDSFIVQVTQDAVNSTERLNLQRHMTMGTQIKLFFRPLFLNSQPEKPSLIFVSRDEPAGLETDSLSMHPIAQWIADDYGIRVEIPNLSIEEQEPLLTTLLALLKELPLVIPRSNRLLRIEIGAAQRPHPSNFAMERYGLGSYSDENGYLRVSAKTINSSDPDLFSDVLAHLLGRAVFSYIEHDEHDADFLARFHENYAQYMPSKHSRGLAFGRSISAAKSITLQNYAPANLFAEFVRHYLRDLISLATSITNLSRVAPPVAQLQQDIFEKIHNTLQPPKRGGSEIRQSKFYTLSLAPHTSWLIPALLLQLHDLTQNSLGFALMALAISFTLHIPQLYLGQEGRENEGKNFWQRLQTLFTRDIGLISALTVMTALFLPWLQAFHPSFIPMVITALTAGHTAVNFQGLRTRA